MKKAKISTKLFILTSLSLVMILSIQLIFQTLYFEKIYLHNKKGHLEKELQSMATRLQSIPNEEMNKQLRLFSQKIGGTAGILTVGMVPLYGFEVPPAYIEVETKEGKVYKVYLLEEIQQNEALLPLLKEGSAITIKGIISMLQTNELYPVEIQIGGESFSLLPAIIGSGTTVASPTYNSSMIEIPGEGQVLMSEEALQVNEQIEGSIRSVELPEKESSGNAYRENKLLELMGQTLSQMHLNQTGLMLGEAIIAVEKDSYVGISNLVGFMPIQISGGIVFLGAVISLQQVEETIHFMNQSTLLLFMVALLLAIGFAYWYARRLTKPLVAIKDVTTAMMQLDFEQQCKVSGQDEIGELASNINQMSMRLKETLETLQEDMRLKEKLNEERKQFMIDVSHELKTPLTVLKATCEGFIDGIYEKEDQVYLQGMLRQIDAMGELVQELLTVVRLEKEEGMQQEVFDLSDSVLKVHASLKTLAKEKDIQVSLKLEEAIVKADRKKIETVIRNYYNNAIFYTASNKKIWIHIKKLDGKWQLSIENEGAVIPTAQLENIWEPFYRLDESRNKALGGSGLGLYIVKKIMESHEASYGIENTSRGVAAWFELEAEKIIEE